MRICFARSMGFAKKPLVQRPDGLWVGAVDTGKSLAHALWIIPAYPTQEDADMRSGDDWILGTSEQFLEYVFS